MSLLYSGVTTFHTPQPPSSPTASKLGRARTTNLSRNNTVEITTSSLRTFKSMQGSFRQGSPSRAIQPTLADLEFPPPPSDLPPPPEEFDNPSDTVDGCHLVEMTKRKRVPISPHTTRKMMEESEADVSNLQPSVEEASSRFGISLRKREPSSESCREREDRGRAQANVSPSEDGKNLTGADSDVPTVGSPLESVSAPIEATKTGKFYMKLHILKCTVDLNCLRKTNFYIGNKKVFNTFNL